MLRADMIFRRDRAPCDAWPIGLIPGVATPARASNGLQRPETGRRNRRYPNPGQFLAEIDNAGYVRSK